MNHTKQLSGDQTDEWLSPPTIISALGKFDLDPASPENRPWPTATKHFTKRDDGLALPWHGRVWLNPPYSNCVGWLQRMAEHQNGVSLIFARTETDWFNLFVWQGARALLFIKRRISFYRLDGVKGCNAPAPSVLAAYSDSDASVLYGCELEGKFIPLRVNVVEIKTTWRKLIRFMLKQTGGECSLEQIYALVSDHPKAAARPHWKAKVRQIVQKECRRVGPAQWQLTLLH